MGPQLLGIIHSGPILDGLARFGLWSAFLMAGFETNFAIIRGRPLRNATFGWTLSAIVAFALAALLCDFAFARSFSSPPGRILTLPRSSLTCLYYPMVPAYALLMLAVRGLPALLLYRQHLPRHQPLALALHSGTQLSLVVAITGIGVQHGLYVQLAKPGDDRWRSSDTDRVSGSRALHDGHESSRSRGF